jgi:putative inorganic carbon (hco3(-)) transporter
LLNQIPVAMIMGAVAVGAYLLLDRRAPPSLSVEMALMIAMMIWVSLTMIWAQAPSAAWEKWDWAFKTLVHPAKNPHPLWHVTPPAVCLSSSSGAALPS